MRNSILAVLGVAAALSLGFAVAGLASSGSSSGAAAETNESTTESTTESPSATTWKATLRAAAATPRPTGVNAGAGGTFSATVTEQGGTYSAKWKLTFKSLTGKAVAAHIHKGKAGKAGAVVVALCGPCTSGKAGTTKLSEAVVKAMKAGLAYVNVHTKKNPAGEIRGQVKKVG